ncbi:MAG: NUDIX domain-containing protein [Chryseolinea sp.]
METIAEFKDFIKRGSQTYRPNTTVDCVIFGFHEGKLKVLLMKNKIFTMWCLPGGYIKKEETLEEAASRIANYRTGINNLFLKQFKAFGDPDRNEAHSVNFHELSKFVKLDPGKPGWLAGPTVSIGFYAITDIQNVKPTPDFFSTACEWFPINKLPKIGFAQDEVIREALFSMRIHLYHFPIGKNLLPEKFTLREIKEFYEVMSGKELNASNFPNKLISIGLIKKTSETRQIGAHRSPTYYTFNKKAYEKALKEGLVLV